MIRTQIQLTEAQVESLKRLAGQRQVSMAELIREGVDRTVAADGRRDRLQRVLETSGKYHGGKSDAAENHDTYLDEIYGS